MSTELEKEYLRLDPSNLEVLTEHALARVRVGEWSEELAHSMLVQVATFHGDAAVQTFSVRVAREIERRRAL